MTELIVNAQSQTLIDRFVSEPSHALMLVGDAGVGLGTIAKAVAYKLTSDAYVTFVSPENGTISIDEIRALYAQTKTKHAERHVVIIDDADAMKHAAQNSILKLLEEPSEGVFFILTSHREQLLLATIQSRVQKILIRPVTAADSQGYIHELKVHDETKARQILFIAGGRPAEMKRLVEDDAHFLQQSARAVDARTFLGADMYERLVMASKYSQREDALDFLGMLGRLAVHMLYRQPDTHYSRRLEAIADATERISGNGHVRTQLARLVSHWA